MKSDNKFPDWIVKSVYESSDKLNPKSKDFFEKIIENLPHFDRCFISIPETSKVGILKNYDPVEVKNHYGFNSPFEFILLNIFEQFHFQQQHGEKLQGVHADNDCRAPILQKLKNHDKRHMSLDKRGE